MRHESQPADRLAEPLENGSFAKWGDALLAIGLAAALSESAGKTLPSIRVRASNGPVLDHWLALFHQAIAPMHINKLPVGIDMDGLLGGLDLESSVSTGSLASREGLLARTNNGVIAVHDCSAVDAEVVSTLLQSFDTGFVDLAQASGVQRHPSRFGLLVVDGQTDDDDELPKALTDRLMFHVELDGIDIRTVRENPNPPKFHSVSSAICGPSELEALVALASAFGLQSMRPPLQAVQVACGHAAIEGRDRVCQADVETGIRLCYLNRATQMPELAEPDEQEMLEEEALSPPQDDGPEQDPASKTSTEDVPDEFDVEAALANLPPDVLALLNQTTTRRSSGKSAGRAGKRKTGFRRGRRLSSIKGRPVRGRKLDLIATLRAAAPWQNIRKKATPAIGTKGVLVRKDDFHVKRFHLPSETTTIFAVDASGSTAVNRLGEAKGAIEILLGESYSRRDHVALVAMRGKAASVLLPPSRSLVLAKRSLSSLAGGGGTPLAHGLQTALLLADDEARRGRAVSVIVLTDGSANIAMDGEPGRARAGEDAKSAARSLYASGHPCLFIDVGKLPGTLAKDLSDAAGACYLPMPFASSHNISSAVRSHRNAG